MNKEDKKRLEEIKVSKGQYYSTFALSWRDDAMWLVSKVEELRAELASVKKLFLEQERDLNRANNAMIAYTIKAKAAEAELTRFKELVFGDRVREKVLSLLSLERSWALDEFQKAVKEALGKHIHVHSGDGDSCGLCGLDLRNLIHLRVGEET